MDSGIRLDKGATILFIGDSITDAERHRRLFAPLGFGYVHFAANWLIAKQPQLGLRIINRGISGDTVADLARRWQEDCIRHRPDVLSVMVGVNDLWRCFADPAEYPGGLRANEYESIYTKLLEQAVEELGCQLVLAEPFMFCADLSNPMFQSLRDYVEVVHRLAVRFGAVCVPLQKKIDQQIVETPSDVWSDDMVHPKLWAHAWIAQQWLAATRL